MTSDSNEPLSPEVRNEILGIAMSRLDTLAALAAAYRLGLATGHGELAGKHAEWCSRVCPCEAAIREAKEEK